MNKKFNNEGNLKNKNVNYADMAVRILDSDVFLNIITPRQYRICFHTICDVLCQYFKDKTGVW